MRLRLTLVVAFAVGVLGVFSATASAATTVGSNCAPTNTDGPFSLVQLTNSDPSELTSVPAAGVITQWIVHTPTPLPQNLDVLRPTGSPNQFTIVSRTPVALTPPESRFGARNAVQAGDRIGLGGALIPDCDLDDAKGNIIGYAEGEQPTGVPIDYATDGQFRLPVLAVVEPDVDGDGYGDETQDGCARSTALQIACPVIQLSTKGRAGKASAKIFVTTTAASLVKVSGVVGKKKLKGRTKSVAAPGKAVPFTIKFPPSLKSRLADLPSTGSLTLRSTASATDALGVVTTSKLKLKLRGLGDG